jgi:hypothetical protein
MDCRLVLGIVLLLGACKTELADVSVDGGTGADGNGSASPDGSGSGNGSADGSTTLGAWGTPAKIPGGDSPLEEDDAVLSSTRLELFFKRIDANGNADLFVMTRPTTSSAWTMPAAIAELNTLPVDEESPRLSANDLTLYFGRGGDIYVATRGAVGMAWGNVQAVAALNTAAYEKWGVACANGYAMVSRGVTGQGQDVFDGTINGGANNSVGVLNSTANEQGLFLTADCLGVYFQSNRISNQYNIYFAERATMASAWTSPLAMIDFNTPMFSEEDPWLATDERTFVYVSNREGNKDLYISTR